MLFCEGTFQSQTSPVWVFGSDHDFLDEEPDELLLLFLGPVVEEFGDLAAGGDESLGEVIEVVGHLGPAVEYANQIKEAEKSLTIMILSVSNLLPGSTYMHYARRRRLDEKVMGHAVSEILGCAFDRDGNWVHSEIEDIFVGVSGRAIEGILKRQGEPAEVVCVAGGKHKVDILRAALRGQKKFNVLVTDTFTAEALLDDRK